MSTSGKRAGYRKTPRNVPKVEKTKIEPTEQIESVWYDYDAALSQPDVSGCFKKENKVISSEDKKVSPRANKKDDHGGELKDANPENLKIRQEVPNLSKDILTTESTANKKPKRGKIPVRKIGTTENKIGVNGVKIPKRSKISSPTFTAFSKLSLKKKTKELSTTKISSANVDEAQQVASSTKPLQGKEIKDGKLSDQSISVIVPAVSKTALFDVKLSEVEADVDLDHDQEFTTTSINDSPRKSIQNDSSAIDLDLRASKLSCSCRSCSDRNIPVSEYRISSDIWTDSRSSPEVTRYSNSKRNERSK